MKKSPQEKDPEIAQRVTIRQVALEAGVSIGTASRVINHFNNVAPDIRERVKAAISKLGYTPDVVAQAMRNGESRTIGILVRDITSPVLAGFVRRPRRVQ